MYKIARYCYLKSSLAQEPVARIEKVFSSEDEAKKYLLEDFSRECRNAFANDPGIKSMKLDQHGYAQYESDSTSKSVFYSEYGNWTLYADDDEWSGFIEKVEIDLTIDEIHKFLMGWE